MNSKDAERLARAEDTHLDEFCAAFQRDVKDLIAEKAALLDLLRRARQSVRIHEAVLSYKTVGPMRSEDVHLVNSLLAEIDAALEGK